MLINQLATPKAFGKTRDVASRNIVLCCDIFARYVASLYVVNKFAVCIERNLTTVYYNIFSGRVQTNERGADFIFFSSFTVAHSLLHIANERLFQCISELFSLFSLSAVSNTMLRVFSGCYPLKVLQAIVRSIVIDMVNVRSIVINPSECRDYEPMHFNGFGDAINTKRNDAITVFIGVCSKRHTLFQRANDFAAPLVFDYPIHRYNQSFCGDTVSRKANAIFKYCFHINTINNCKPTGILA